MTKLSPAHERLILESAISADVAAARGYETVTEKRRLADLGFSKAQLLTPTLLVPIRDAEGDLVLHQHRPDFPRGTEHKRIKYETPARARMRLDIPLGARHSLEDASCPLFITEGARKADAGVTAGLCTIALLGVWNWRGTLPSGGKGPLEDWNRIRLLGRSVYLVFDSDVLWKLEVQRALLALTEFLDRRGARVSTVYLPPAPDGAKVGLDDFLAAGGTVEELQRLLDPPPNFPGASFMNSAQRPVTAAAAKSGTAVVTFSAADLQREHLPPPRHAVPGVLPEGLVLLTGKPKAKKSWLVLNICVALAAGTRVLGRVDLEPADVLYLALEDGPRRLKDRLQTILGEGPFPSRLDFRTHSRRFDEGGIEDIEDWLVRHPNAKLVAVDTLAWVRPPRQRNGNSYDEDYAHLSAIKEVADRHGVCILLVHHLRKADSDDPLDLVSGTNGLAGAADTILILKKSSAAHGIDAQLHIRSRDIEDADLAMNWRAERGTWEIAGEWEELAIGGHWASIRGALAGGRPRSLREIAAKTGIEYRVLSNTVARLVHKGDLQKVSRGLYSLQEDVVGIVDNERKDSNKREAVSSLRSVDSNISNEGPGTRLPRGVHREPV